MNLACWLLGAEVAFFVPWIAWVISSRPEKLARAPDIYFTSYGFLVGMVLAASLILLWYLNREPVRAYFQSNEWSDGDAG